MAVQILSVGLVFGIIFKSEMATYLPWLAVSLVFWNLISSTVIEACSAYIAAQGIIHQLKIPMFVHVVRVIWRNLFTTGHNFLIIPLVIVFFRTEATWSVFLILPGLALLIVNLYWLSSSLALLATRYRDVIQIVTSITTVAFYVTPVMWLPTALGDDALGHYVLGLNPLYHWLQLVRLPLLGQVPTIENWAISGSSAVIGSIASVLLMRQFQHKIAFWI